MGEEVEVNVTSICQDLKSDVKSTRRTGLSKLKKLAGCEEDLSSFLPCFDSLVNIVTKDSSENHRETAAGILLCLVTSTTVDSQSFESFIKLTVETYGEESSEEVRLLLVKIVSCFLDNHSFSQQVYLEILDQLTRLLKAMLSDKYGEVVKEACGVITTLSEVNEHFRLQADYFVTPLVQNLKTQPMKVRIPCVKALEPVIIHSPLTIPNIIPQLEKSWSESGPPLKLAMVQTVGKASLELELDDQNFHFLIPVILLGKCNDFSEVVEYAENKWKELKNQTGFDDILTKSFCKILPKLLKDTEDWNNDMRVQTSQLICQFLQDLPDRKCELSTVMEIITFQAGDQEAPVRNWACRSARLVGENCAQDALLWLSNRTQQKDDSAITNSDVVTYSYIVRGFLNANQSYTPTTIDLCVDLAVKFSLVQDPSLIDCVEALLEKNVTIDTKRMNQLMCVALSLEGPKESDFCSRQMAILERIAANLQFADISTMIRQRLPDLWTTFEEPPDKWTVTSLPWKIIQFVAGEMKIVNPFIFDQIHQTISFTTSPEMKLKCFNLLTASMERIECDSEQLQSLLLTNVKWKPGRSASVLRSCVTLCAYAAITQHKVEIVPSNLNVFVESFLPLVEDEITSTRLATIRILRHCLLLGVGQPTKLDVVLTTLMERLNDISKDVRHGVMVGLQDMFLQLRQSNGPHSMEKKFIQLVRVLSRDDDLPSQTFAEGVLRTMVEGSLTTISLDEMKKAIEAEQRA